MKKQFQLYKCGLAVKNCNSLKEAYDAIHVVFGQLMEPDEENLLPLFTIKEVLWENEYVGKEISEFKFVMDNGILKLKVSEPKLMGPKDVERYGL